MLVNNGVRTELTRYVGDASGAVAHPTLASVTRCITRFSRKQRGSVIKENGKQHLRKLLPAAYSGLINIQQLFLSTQNIQAFYFGYFRAFKAKLLTYK